MTDGKASPGGLFQVPPAGIWNGMVDAGLEFTKRRKLGDDPQFSDIRTDIVKVKNNTGAQRSLGHVVEVGAPLLTDIRRHQLWFGGEEPDDTTYRLPAILLAALPNGDIGDAQISGIAVARINMLTSGHAAAKVADATCVLQSAPFGQFRILYAPSGTGEKTCVVEMPARHGGGFVAKTTSAITAATGTSTRTVGSGTCDLYRRNASGVLAAVTGMASLTIYNSTTQAAVSGVWIQGKLDIFGECWWDVADCP